MTDSRLSFGGKPRPCAHLFNTVTATTPNLNLHHVSRPGLVGSEETTVFGLTRKAAIAKVAELREQSIDAVAVQTVTGLAVAGRGVTVGRNGKTAKRRLAAEAKAAS